MTTTIVERLGQWVADFTLDQVPSPVIADARLHTLDTVGVGIGAAVLPGEADSARAARIMAAAAGGQGAASVYGLHERVSAPMAAMVNGSLQHSLDFDDIHTDSRVHTSTMTVPAALALGESVGASGRDVLAAIILGNEVSAQIGMAFPRHVQHFGFHGTPVCGVFGVAAGAAYLLGLTAHETAHALGIAGDVAGGTNAWIAEGTSNKHLHAGWAAQNGITSALLAKEGAKGPRGAFEGRFGIFDALGRAPDVSPDTALASLGQRWATSEIAYKAYPSCYWMHASVGAAEQLRPVILDNLASVDVLEAVVPSAAIPLVLDPRESRIQPQTPYAAKFSLQYSVAAMILRGQIDLSTYTEEALGDRNVLQLASRVTWRIEPSLDAGSQLYAGGLTVRFLDGREETVILDEPLGTPGNPMSEAAIIQKYRACAQLGLPPSLVEQLENAVLQMDQAEDVADIATALRSVGPPS